MPHADSYAWSAAVHPFGFRPFELRLHPPGELVSDALRAAGTWEPAETEALRRLLRPGDRVLDVGANLGYYTRLAHQRVGSTGRVFAFEPDPRNFDLLARNCAGLPWPPVVLRRRALGRHSGEGFLRPNVANRGDQHLTPQRGADDVPIRVLRGDELGLAGVQLIKIDTQGSELAVLDGLTATIRCSLPDLSLLVEFWPYGLHRQGEPAAALAHRLMDLELPIFLIDHQQMRLMPLSPEAFRELALERLDVARQGFVNLLLSRRLRHNALDLDSLEKITP